MSLPEIVIEDKDFENHSATSNDIKECCKDIKVLGRKELRSLLNWRSKLRRHIAKRLKEESKGSLDGINLSSDEEGSGSDDEEEKEAAEEDEEEKLDQKLAELKAEELAALKRKKKQLLKAQRRQKLRMELKMDLPGVSIADGGDTDMFSLKAIGRNELLQSLSRGDMAAADALVSQGDLNNGDICISDVEEEDEISLASDLDEEDLTEVRKWEKKMEKPRKTTTSEEPEDEDVTNPLLVSLEDKSDREERDKNLWFGKGIFSSVLHDADEEMEIKQTKILQEGKSGTKTTEKKETKKKRKKTEATPDVSEKTGGAPEAPVQGAESLAVEAELKGSTGDDSDSDSDSSDDERKIRSMRKKRGKGTEEDDDFEVVPVERPVKRSRVLDPEGLALGTVIATSKKATRDLIDNSFNRRAFNDDEDDLPDWFVSEEKKHRVVQIPVDRETMEEYRRRQRELNARPIKKIAEAKARKRRRMLKKMEQARKKAEAVVNTVDISEREKTAQLRSIYKKAGLGKEKRQVTYVVAKKGVGRKVRRPAGVKGQFKVVDGRMKKDMRGQQQQRRRGR
ncbi:hypothetical protein GDO81_025732 [Engystomops pustulosus]|uniref:Pre-rRNA processing protein FTSJ3 n=2 Tax=Engystomops pustulosus TaxID=76066 RepID=A0AAV6ZJE3_ENGPU|nr:hypothetical protein GDO81_025732 [Engystomops pustulosus]